MTAAILAGGLGTRLRSVVADQPKVLAEVQGRPFLAYLLDRIATAGVKKAVLCTGHRGEQIEAEFGDSYGALQLEYSRETSALGTAGALRLAVPLLSGDHVLAMNGDAYSDADLTGFWRWHRDVGSRGSLLLAHMTDTERYGLVDTDDDGRVKSFKEKQAGRGPGWINAGVYLLSRRMLLGIPRGREVSIEREVFPSWVGRGLYGYRAEGRFLDIGLPESYAEADEFFANMKPSHE